MPDRPSMLAAHRPEDAGGARFIASRRAALQSSRLFFLRLPMENGPEITITGTRHTPENEPSVTILALFGAVMLLSLRARGSRP